VRERQIVILEIYHKTQTIKSATSAHRGRSKEKSRRVATAGPISLAISGIILRLPDDHTPRLPT
jgi:hypothetical protein